MELGVNEALLAILSALVGAMIWLVKSMQTRSDKLIEQRDREVSRLIGTLEAAVGHFADFKEREDEIHGEILAGLEGSVEIQGQVLSEIKAVGERLPAAKHGS